MLAFENDTKIKLSDAIEKCDTRYTQVGCIAKASQSLECSITWIPREDPSPLTLFPVFSATGKNNKNVNISYSASHEKFLVAYSYSWIRISGGEGVKRKSVVAQEVRWFAIREIAVGYIAVRFGSPCSIKTDSLKGVARPCVILSSISLFTMAKVWYYFLFPTPKYPQFLLFDCTPGVSHRHALISLFLKTFILFTFFPFHCRYR